MNIYSATASFMSTAPAGKESWHPGDPLVPSVSDGGSRPDRQSRASRHTLHVPCNCVPALPPNHLWKEVLSLKNGREEPGLGRACRTSRGPVQPPQEILDRKSYRLEPLRPEKIRRRLIFRREEKDNRGADRHRRRQRVNLSQHLLDVVYREARQGGRIPSTESVRSTPNVGPPSLGVAIAPLVLACAAYGRVCLLSV